ncbi:MAG TPA: malto-oligosyltrehalose trehalohydrolase [Rhodocyclaceae bacterium]|nr:malto-oligosyltrehalose trehalohydrolase [Rhodocyclaceae bacterium]
MRRRHAMPFGAEPAAGGGVRFRLWAPSVGAVTLAVDGRRVPMEAQLEGWFAARVERARAGSLYSFVTDGGPPLPDPASRFNPEDVHGPSEVVDPTAFDWRDDNWRGRPWEEAVIYELHVGAFTPAGTFAGVAERLGYLSDLGVTAIELMPVADFSGARNWGYDGVLPFAPDSRYGRPEDLKELVQRAHGLGLMVLLDVVYNHFGPDGNYLSSYAAPFFTERHATPWGPAIDFEGPASRTVRDFYIHNALYWLEEYHLDGLRFDAIHAISDASVPDIVEEIADRVRGPGGPAAERHIHLILENERNQAHYLERDGNGRPVRATAQWNDDIHHAFHVLLTGERDGYYADYAEAPVAQLGRCLAQGFAFQGDVSACNDGEPRGEPSAHLPPGAFVNFLQNHDQIGNRAFGERLCHLAGPEPLAAATAVLLLAPSPPLLFMGEEFGAAQPFLFFCDFAGHLAAAVTAGRRAEFAAFSRFADPEVRAHIPDPNAEATFAASVLDWECLARPPHDRWLALYRELLALRRERIVPRLAGMAGGQGSFQPVGTSALAVSWHLGDGSRLALLANLGPRAALNLPVPAGEVLYRSGHLTDADIQTGGLAPWSVAWFIAPPVPRGR